MKTSQAGIDLIKSFESLRLSAYLDQVGVPTIGYGHTAGVSIGDTITEHQADVLLANDLQDAERDVARQVHVALTPGQHSALVSWVFNLGGANLASSTLLRYLNAGEYQKARNELLRWVNADGRPSAGLKRRRLAEFALWGDTAADFSNVVAGVETRAAHELQGTDPKPGDINYRNH